MQQGHVQKKEEAKKEPPEKKQKKPAGRGITAIITGILLLSCCVLGVYGYMHCWFGHIWQAADCTTGRVCTRCSAIAEEPLGHLWQDATCTAPKICSRCSATEGKALGHSWKAATCTTPKTCSRCKATEGKELGHKWEAATCTTKMTCKKCGQTSGAALGHKWKAATCSIPKTCTRCAATSGKALGHSWPTMEKLSYCTRCEFPNGQLKSVDQSLCQTSWTNQMVGFTLSSGKYVDCNILKLSSKIEKCYSLTLCLQITDYSHGNINGEWGFYIRDLNGTWHLADTFTLSGKYVKAHFEFDEPISFDAWGCPCHVLGYSWSFSYSAWLEDVTVFKRFT